MTVGQKYEAARLALQTELDAKKTREERNVLGQFATPTELAKAVLAYAVDLIPQGNQIRFLDPAIGTGAFYSALRETTPAKRIKLARGFEIDPHYGLPARELWSRTSLEIDLRDFTAAQAPAKEKERFNLLVCNPPYVRHHHILNGEKARLQDASQLASGERITGLAGLYCYFIALSHAWMSEGGIAAWLVPSEFMDVNYGRAVKRYLLDKVSLLRIHRFDPNDLQFGDAMVSSAVVFFRKEVPHSSHQVEFTFGGTIRTPALTRMVSAYELAKERKWTRFPASNIREQHEGVTLGDLFRIKRGLATGNNSFFILTKEQIEEKQLPWEFFKPILPSPRYVKSDHIKSDKNGNPDIEKQLFLLDCRIPEGEIKSAYPKLWSYLQTGKPNVSDRYLCRSRKPWYSQEVRPPSPFVSTYLGRNRKGKDQPFRFILNESNATAANVYLMLYPKPVLADALARNKKLVKEIWKFLNGIRAENLLDEGRVYGGGLHKLEPKELANVLADEIAEIACLEVQPSKGQPDMFEGRVA